MTYLTSVPFKTLLQIGLGVAGQRRGYRDNAVFRHRAVMALFPQDQEQPRESLGILFRLEQTPKGPRFLIRSSVAPAAIPTVITRKENEVPSGPVSFRVTVNPVVRTKNRERFLTDYDELTQWLENRLSPALQSVEIVGTQEENLQRSLESRKDFIKLVQFDGVAEVDNQNALSSLLLTGVGRAKNYGAGLLTVRAL